jgi:glycosyltransferase involved in cell wall biosynthesis
VKIFHIITTIDRGGAENQLLLLAKMQVLLGHKVYIFYLKGKSELKNDFLKNKIVINNSLENITFFAKILVFTKHILVSKPDIIHAHLPESELVARLSFRGKSKFFITRHFGGQFHPKTKPLISAWLGRISSKPAVAVIAISDSVSKNLIKNKEVYDNRKIFRVYYGFSKTDFLANIKINSSQLFSNRNNKICIGTVSRLSPEKDLETLINACNILVKKIPNLELYIIGEGPLKDSLKKLTLNLGIEKKVIFLGKQSRIANFMQNISLFVLTSKFEGFGMVLLEAMATNTKIIASRNSAIIEVIGNQNAGVFFETSNHEELAQKSFDIIVSNSQKHIIDQNKRILFFDCNVMVTNIMDLYNKN